MTFSKRSLLFIQIRLLSSILYFIICFLRYLIRIFGISICHSTVIVLECITLPCLKILLEHVYFTSILSLKYAPLVTCDIFQSSRSYNTISIGDVLYFYIIDSTLRV